MTLIDFMMDNRHTISACLFQIMNNVKLIESKLLQVLIEEFWLNIEVCLYKRTCSPLLLDLSTSKNE